MARRKGRITGWETGQKIRTINETRAGHWPGRVLPAGTEGTLQDCERVQDGAEVWSFWIPGPTLWVARHTDLERISS